MVSAESEAKASFPKISPPGHWSLAGINTDQELFLSQGELAILNELGGFWSFLSGQIPTSQKPLKKLPLISVLVNDLSKEGGGSKHWGSRAAVSPRRLARQPGAGAEAESEQTGWPRTS